MKIPKILFFASMFAAIAFVSGCQLPPMAGEGPILRVGNTAYESPTKAPWGGKGAFHHSDDMVVIANNCPQGYFVDLYENARQVFTAIPSGGVMVFHPDDPRRDAVVAFRSVTYTVGANGEKCIISTYSQMIAVNKMYGPTSVVWDVGQYGVSFQQQTMCSSW